MPKLSGHPDGGGVQPRCVDKTRQGGAQSLTRGGEQMTDDTPHILDTALTPLWQQLNAKLVPFAHTNLPLQFAGTLREHAAVRTSAGLFDIAHMGQITVHGAEAAHMLAALLPLDTHTMPVGRVRYSFFLNELGGILDDIMVTRTADGFILVVNGARREVVLEHLSEHCLPSTFVQMHGTLALLALQGPAAAAVLANVGLDTTALPFMHSINTNLAGSNVRLTRCGYSGEDGFEISVPNKHAIAVANVLLADARVTPCGLAARDTLRLEAGLPLYGNDLSEDTDPISAGLRRFMAKNRLQSADFMGASAVLPLLQNAPTQQLVGLRPQGARPVRAGAVLTNSAGETIGRVTSGTFSPTLGLPISMGYVNTPIPDQVLANTTPLHVVPLPFVAHQYYKG